MSAWIVAIGSFVLLAVLWDRRKPKFIWWVKPLLAAMGASAFALTSWGQTIAGWMLGALGWIGAWFGTSGAVIAGIVTVALVVIVLLDIFADRVANTPAIGSLLVLPLLFLIAAGPIASGGQQLSENFANAGASSVGRLVGGG